MNCRALMTTCSRRREEALTCPAKKSEPPYVGGYKMGEPFSVRRARAFTLVEVMIAMGIFFMAVFAILALVTTNLRNARNLQKQRVDATMLISQLSLTNQLTAGSDSGDFGELYPGYRWTSEITEITNGLFQVEYLVTGPPVAGSDPAQTHMAALLWRPNSPSSLTPGMPR
jgi:type II secretory pathway pseudopilin PulG